MITLSPRMPGGLIVYRVDNPEYKVAVWIVPGPLLQLPKDTHVIRMAFNGGKCEDKSLVYNTLTEAVEAVKTLAHALDAI